MNAERLHAIVGVLKKEVTETRYPDHLKRLVKLLHAAAKNSKDQNLREQISGERETLRAILSTSVTDDFSPVWKQEIQAMQIEDILGRSLLRQIEDVLTTPEKPLDIAAAEMLEIHKLVQKLVGAVNGAASSLHFFRIGSEHLDPGDFEIGFMIPRKQVNDGLEELGSEFIELKQIVGPFSELAGENRPEVNVRTISSSDFQVLLVAAPPVAASVAYALDRLASAYERIVHIRLMNKELADTEIPEDVLDPLTSYTDSLIKVEIEKIAEELTAKSDLVDEGRLNELRTDLQMQLNALSQRIERGYNVEVRTGELSASDEDQDELDSSTKEAVNVVQRAQQNIKFLNSREKPIPRLEEPDGLQKDRG